MARRTKEQRDRAAAIAAAVAAAPTSVIVHIGPMVHNITAERAKELIAQNQEYREQILILVRVGEKLANCCANAANAGGFKDFPTGATAQQVCDTLRESVKCWDYVAARATGKQPPHPLPITERR